ncbi:chemotaxis protein CheW [Chamaesiphon polymorphus]|uniref:Chemotaxis protein CheW n=1 Tax=Chamaesiphon polymorphus CCALA 037 TaxID=2107692 RepID=A0A2T1G6A0_9CYAN|nr:chemotaxis protein CheW [Chamaesiphon polymorphus]PSB52733.1 chemotaxis protein CheW [Chamaesiphon polymorphus CCALA 037]
MVLNLDFLTSDDNPETNEVSTSSRDGELCLRFDVPSGNEFALPASGVREVMSVYFDRITPIPNASPFFLGTYNWRGQVIWVADLGQFLGDRVLVNTDQNEVSVLIVEEQELVMGFAVHTVANTEWLDIERVLPPDRQIPAAMKSYVKGVYSTGSDKPELRLLDQVAILRSSQWTI